MKVKLNESLLLLLLFTICFLPAAILSHYAVVDPYNCITLATAEQYMHVGKLAPIEFGDFRYDPEEQGHQGYECFVIVLLVILGGNSVNVATLPIGGIIVPILYFILARRLFNSNLIACSFAIYVAFDPSLLPGHYNIFVYTIERSLFFAFIFIEMLILKAGKSTDKSMLLIFMFISTFSVYWTTPVLMATFLLIVNLLLILNVKVNSAKNDMRKVTIPVVVSFIVIYLAFSKVLYNDYIPSVRDARYGTQVDALMQLVDWLTISQSPKIGNEYIASTSGDGILNIILILRYLVILTPIIVYLGLKCYDVLKHKKIKATIDIYSLVMWSIFVTGVVQTLAYSARGHLSIRYIGLLFLPLTVISLIRLNSHKLKVLTLLLLCSLVVFGYAYTYSQDFSGLNKVSGLKNGADFLFNHSHEQDTMLTDLNTFGPYLVESVNYGTHPEIVFYSTPLFSLIVNPYDTNLTKNSEDNLNYVVINKKLSDSPTAATSWVLYQPLDKYFGKIDQNMKINRMYNDGNIWIFYVG